MADRYWILGTGTWDSTSTTNWSDTSGGTGGFSVPTASDNVFFDANSNVLATAFTVTMANSPRVCRDFLASGLDGTMTLAGTGIGLTVSGSLTFQATNFTRTYTGTTTFNATTTGKTVTTNGVSVVSVVFDGVGGNWTLGSALTTGTITVTNGTFDTSSSGNYAVSASTFSSSNSNVRTINLNASTITLSGTSAITFTTSTNLTLNAGTSTINLSSASATFAGGGLTYYNVAFTSTAITLVTLSSANTFNNLSITGRTTVGISQIRISANQTINGTFTASAGTASAYRIMFFSDTTNTTRTLTCAAVSLTDTDFIDITIGGAASPASGTRLGDVKGNSGITFPAAKTVFYRQTGSANWGATGSGSWSATSGGALDATQFPLAQDTAVFPAATYPASGSTTTVNASYNIGTIDMSLRTSNTMTLATGTTNPLFCGNWINGTGITISGTGIVTFAGRTTQQITSANIAFTQPILISSPSGTFQLQDAFTTGTTRTTTLNFGTLDLQSFTLSTGLFSSNNSNTRTIAFGTGNITCTGTGIVWQLATVTNLTTTGTQVVNVTSVGSTAITVNPGALSEANSISFNFTGGTYALAFLSATNDTARNVNFTGYAGTLVAINTVSLYGDLLLSTGMTLTASTGTLQLDGSATKNITTNSKTIDFPISLFGNGSVVLQDALTMGATRLFTLNYSTINLNGKTLTVGTSFQTAGAVAATKNLTFNGGTLVCPAATSTAFNNAAPTYFTTTAGTGTGTISMTAATAKTFVGGGSTFNCTLNQGGAGALTITGSNTFSNITNTVQPASILFTAGTTSTFTNFSLSGTSGNLITIGSVTAASHTLSKASGTVSSDFLSISRSTATGGAAWYAGANSTDGGNNTGWSFAAAPAASSGYPYGSGHYGIGPYNIGNLVISGNVSTTAVGTLLADRSIQEDGTIATGNVGTVALTVSVDITGNAATGAVNSVLVSPIITGNAATGAVGTMGAEVISFQAITGVNGTGSVGSVSNVISIGIIGVESIGAVGTMIGYGWGSIPNTSESWTSISDTSESWTDLSDNSITWQEAA